MSSHSRLIPPAVRVASSARGRASRLRAIPLGLALLAPSVLLTGCFSAPPQIVQLDPPAGATQLDANATIQVVFDQPVRHQSVAAHLSVFQTKNGQGLSGCTLTAAFSAHPGAPCWISWLSGESGFVLHHPGALFAPNTEYTVDLGAGVTSAGGNLNSLDHIWNLTSAAAPVLTSSTPGGGTTVPRDTPIVLNFSRAMAPAAVAASVSLSPPATGLRVVANPHDPAQLEVLPDRPLAPSTAYSLTLSRRATDAHGQPIAAPVTVSFHTTALLSTAGHLLVLAGPGAGEASEVAVAQLASPASGLPVPVEVLDSVPLCAEPGGCGPVGFGEPTAVIDDATLAPGGRWLAVVQTDVSQPGAPPVLRIVSVQTGLDQLDLGGATWPAWSPDGSTLAFVAADGSVQLFDTTTESLSELHAGSPPSGPPTWTADGAALAIPAAATAATPAHVDLADPALSARYPLPGISGAASRLVAGPQGEELAVELTSSVGAATTWVVDPTGGQPPLRVGTNLTPVGFTDSTTLVVAAGAPGSGQLLEAIQAGTGAVSRIATGPGVADPLSAAVAPGGRQIAYITTLASGMSEAVIANANGSGALALSPLATGLEPLSVQFGG